jgi:ADP-ribose pyrophosphatase YjhB (NUDIX family)
MKTNSPRWLDWAREIQALAQISLTYNDNPWQRARSQRLMEIAAEIISEHTGLSASHLVERFHAQEGYATPKIDVRGAVFQDGNLLLVRERADGSWSMPGGWVGVGDAPAEAVEREVMEESGFRVRACKLIGVYDANRVKPLGLFHAFKLVFLCDLLGGQPQSSDETSEVDFFSQNAIPTPLSEYRTPPRVLADVFKAYTHNETSTVFD